MPPPTHPHPHPHPLGTPLLTWGLGTGMELNSQGGMRAIYD